MHAQQDFGRGNAGQNGKREKGRMGMWNETLLDLEK